MDESAPIPAMRTQTITDLVPNGTDPRFVRITREQLYSLHGYARSKGYQHVADLVKDGTFPRPIGDTWRLDHLLAWEDFFALAGLRAAQAAELGATALSPAPAQPLKRGPGRPKREAA